jgi:hypothetical protein
MARHQKAKKPNPKRAEARRQGTAELLSLILSERRRILASGSLDLHREKLYRGLISKCLWFHSTGDGKYQGCRYWSTGAMDSVKRHGKPRTNKRKYGEDALRHEHLFPRNELVDFLLEQTATDAVSIRRILDRLNIGVVVTIREDNRLPKEVDAEDPWTRYRTVGVECVDKHALDAFLSDLPQLIAERQGQWVAYQGTRRLGFSGQKHDMYQQCSQMGLPREEFTVFCIEPQEMEMVLGPVILD